ncbi:hypothetical protein SAY87_017643 [Trapa incisa]|uniref:Uncharacterized protein n=1 Tax=Trapa incisa TaxID=236973 RepID=A0AAN7LAA2_9MYRT|nr:hypothetical protein SAY87_017643 [Trapa incisa]
MESERTLLTMLAAVLVCPSDRPLVPVVLHSVPRNGLPSCGGAISTPTGLRFLTGMVRFVAIALPVPCRTRTSSFPVPFAVAVPFLDHPESASAACCPFSHRLALKYNVLSSMFPQIVHLAVEQSSTTPRYIITTWVLFASASNSLTGLEPVHDMEEDVLMRQDRSSQKGMLKREPFLMLSILFLCSRVLMMGLPRTLSWLKSFWTSCVSHVNLGIFGETSQILSGVLQMIDVRRFRMMLRHCKPQSFCGGTRNARVWASSLASVSQ